MQIQFLTYKPIRDYGTVMMRCIQPLQYLSEGDWIGNLGQIHQSLPLQADVIVFHRVQLDQVVEAVIDQARRNGIVLIYDTDDLIFSDKVFSLNTADKYRSAMQLCDLITVSTDYLAEEARYICADARVIRNGLSRKYIQQSDQVFDSNLHKSKQSVVIGYCSGSNHHDGDFAIILPALIQILDANLSVSFRLIGKIKMPEQLARFGDRVDFQSFIPYEEFPCVYSDIDINIVPLDLSDHIALGRSELKYMEAGACGVVTVASPNGAYRHAITDGVNGVLAEMPNDWQAALQKLIDSSYLRRKLGMNARTHVLEHYGPNQRVSEWAILMQDALTCYRRKNTYPYTFLRRQFELMRIFFLQKEHALKSSGHRLLRRHHLNRNRFL